MELANSFNKSSDLLVYNYAPMQAYRQQTETAIYRADVAVKQSIAAVTPTPQQLQTAGHVVDVAAVGCAFSVVCAPAAPYIAATGATLGAIGNYADKNQTFVEASIKTFAPMGVGKLGVKAVASAPYVAQPVKEAYGVAVDKITGATIDQTYNCARGKEKC